MINLGNFLEKEKSIEEAIFSKLEPSLREKNGEMVLIDRIRSTQTRGGGCFNTGSYFETNEIRAGVLKEPYLIKGKFFDSTRNMELIVQQQVKLKNRMYLYSDNSIESLISLEEGNILLDWNDYLGTPVSFSSFPKTKVWVKDLNIYIGDKDVEGFILNHYAIRGSDVYVHLNTLLKSSQKIQEIKDFEFKIKREGIIKKLEDLLDHESKLSKKITDEHDTIVRNTDDEAFARLSTYEKREELKTIRWRIMEDVKDAIALGMDKENSRYIVDSLPGKRTEIIIGEYITALNERYQEKPKEVV